MQAGIAARTIRLPSETTEAALLAQIARLNADPAVDGILVQLPLPPQVRTQAVIEAVDPAKDVDGFHPVNVGRLAAGSPCLVPCTPAGVMQLLEADGLALDGARALVLGRSAIVGRPMAALLLAANATVTTPIPAPAIWRRVPARGRHCRGGRADPKWCAATGWRLAPRSSISG